MRILKIQTGSRLEWYPRIVKSMTRIHVVLWRSYVHILPPKQLKDKTFFTADVEEALLYAPTLALNLQWSPRTNRGCSTELTAVMSHVCVTNRSDHKGVEIKEKFNADRHKDLFLCALLIRRFYDYRGLLGDRQGINTGPF